MTTTYRSRFLRVMRDNEERMSALFEGLAAFAVSRVLRTADEEGQIPRSAMYDLQREIGDRIMRTFLSPGREGQLAPFEVLPDRSVYPLSSYMRALWTGITEAMQIPVEQHAAIMERRLPADLKLQLKAGRASEQGEVFTPNPLAQYDAPHLWLDPNGHDLSDRIWRTANNTRRRMDMMLEDYITRGRGALPLAKDIEQFLQPGRQLIRTKTPYGTDVSYDAMRLARTEISRAHAQAHEASARANPFVVALRWRLSPQHPCCDVCDTLDGKEFPLDDLPALPAHPQCLCRWENVMTEDRDEILQIVRNELNQAAAIITPLLVKQFLNRLLKGPVVTRALEVLT